MARPHSRYLLACEVDGPYINAPVWPWVTAGWLSAAFFMLAFLLAWELR